MGKYSLLVEEIIRNIGGKENIISLTHCVTRLRFNLEDEDIALDDNLKSLDGVVTVMKTAGQYQVVIGNHVPDVFTEVLKQANINEDNQVVTTKKMSIIDQGIDILSGVMMPSIMILCAAGIIKGFLALFVAFGLLDMTSSWYILFYAIGDSMFYFFPIILGFNAAKKFNMNPYMGLMLGAILCYPTLNGAELTFFGHTITLMYTGTVLPIIFICAMAAPIERLFKKIVPDVIKSFMVPVFVLLVMAPIGFLLIGPIANLISALLAMFVNTIYGISPILAGLFLGFFWQIIVIFGVHMVILIPSIINLMSGTPDNIMALIVAASFAQTGMVFAIWVKTKNQKLKDIAFPAWVSGIFGVTEPAIYGVTLPRRKYFIITCIISGIGGAMAGFLKVQTFQMAGMGIFGFPGNIAPDGNLHSFVWAIIIALLATVVAAVIGFILYKDEGDDLITIENQKTEFIVDQSAKQTQSVLSPIAGVVYPLTDVEDAAFSQGLLGDGMAIEPSEGIVCAPFDGSVVTLLPTMHAIGIRSNSGCEILIHIGMDTVKLKGMHFQTSLTLGDQVKKGDKLISFDIIAIKEKGYSVITPIIVTNTTDYLDVVPVASDNVKIGDEILKALA